MSAQALLTPHPIFIRYPEQAAVNRSLPKNKVYQHSGAGARIKDLFVEQVDQIVWAYKLAPDTINLPAQSEVQEIQIFHLALKTPALHHDVLHCLDDAIPLPIIFELYHQGRTQAIAAYKRPALSGGKSDPEHWVHSSYFSTAWLPSDTPRTALPSTLDLSGLYETLLRQLIPLAARSKETLTEQVERVAQVTIMQREIDQMASRLAKEKQFNRKVDINHALRKLKNELQEIMT
ncbi:DUF4391 domain-containing protein [Paralcaligenes ureilyticus]|uniref:Uncharacterized protein DUF4391 n=1 Tax=Paralcaligenes ureilyticus TaxID=627131 RepID=A0A4R3MDN9_9BURK|nr:DUF4391 domain-containing protein [Paralcaligenes ureilyticus]TCT11053.1 uncharacterized protein DUF4391 [Paralcaligenes ureilyticus]